jgi:hypothetical protein
VFLSLISVSSNVPSPVLRSKSITLPGYCMNVLKKFTSSELAEQKKKDHFVALVCTLIQWNKCSDVLDHVSLCFDSVFKSSEMNVTVGPQER